MNEDMWVEIFKRLPMKTLGQIRCVCKSWNSTISSSLFITTHHSFTSSSSSDDTHLVTIGYFNFLEETLERAMFYAFSNHQKPLKIFNVPFRHPLKASFFYRTIGVINGVICLAGESVEYAYCAILWNPTIRKYVKILPSTQHQQWRRVIGFGFNSRMNEFKVIVEMDNAFEVFSTQQGNWRRINASHIGSFQLLICDAFYSCFNDNNIHWILERRSNREKLMLIFDCESDEFKILDFPEEINDSLGSGKNPPWLNVKPRTGKLSVLQIRRPGEKGREVDEWVMEKAIWKKLPARNIVHVHLSNVRELRVHNGFQAWRPVPGMLSNALHRPVNSHVFRPSLLLMDWKSEGSFIYTRPSI